MASGSLLSLSQADVKFTGEYAYSSAGSSVSGAGDVDADGFDDLLVGALIGDTYGLASGAAYLVLGGPALLASGSPRSLSSADVNLIGDTAGDQAGSSVAGTGDVDGDGFDDLLVGATEESSGSSSAGATYLILGGGF